MQLNFTVINVDESEKKHLNRTLGSYRNINAVFVGSVEEAIKYMRRNRAEAVFLNIRSYLVDWRQQYEELVSYDNSIKIVLMSDNRIDAIKAFELGAFDFINKPIDDKRLEKVINKIRDNI